MAKWVMGLVLAAVFAVFFGTFAGRVEGYLFPVVSHTQVIRVEPTKENWSLIWGRAERLRDCNFKRIEWMIGTPRNSALVDVNFLDKATARPTGSFEFGPWELQLTEDQLRDRSFARVFHQCHPFWVTETHFYP